MLTSCLCFYFSSFRLSPRGLSLSIEGPHLILNNDLISTLNPAIRAFALRLVRPKDTLLTSLPCGINIRLKQVRILLRAIRRLLHMPVK